MSGRPRCQAATPRPRVFRTQPIFTSVNRRSFGPPRDREPFLPLKNQRRLSLVGGALEFFVPAFLSNVNRAQIVRMD